MADFQVAAVKCQVVVALHNKLQLAVVNLVVADLAVVTVVTVLVLWADSDHNLVQ